MMFIEEVGNSKLLRSKINQINVSVMRGATQIKVHTFRLMIGLKVTVKLTSKLFVVPPT